MDIAIISLFPESFRAVTDFGISRRACGNLVNLHYFNPRDFTEDHYKTIDDRPYGGGPGMVMLAEPIARAIEAAKLKLGEATEVIYLSPQGEVLSQHMACVLSKTKSLILLCGRYEGVDERLLDTLVDREISIGDYVLSGGELPAMVLIDAMLRLLPGALGDETSHQQDSFSQEGLLDCPHYTRPEVWRDKRVPQVLLSGNHKEITAWRKKVAKERTQKRRPDLSKIRP